MLCRAKRSLEGKDISLTLVTITLIAKSASKWFVTMPSVWIRNEWETQDEYDLKCMDRHEA